MSNTIQQDALELRELKSKRDDAKVEYEEKKFEYDEATRALLDRMEEEQCQSTKVDGTQFVPAETTYGQLQDRSEFVAWAEENNDELLEKKERKQLLNQLVRERLDNGEEMPPGVGFYIKQYISLRAD